jgi:chromosome segregation ATPase
LTEKTKQAEKAKLIHQERLQETIDQLTRQNEALQAEKRGFLEELQKLGIARQQLQDELQNQNRATDVLAVYFFQVRFPQVPLPLALKNLAAQLQQNAMVHDG